MMTTKIRMLLDSMKMGKWYFPFEIYTPFYSAKVKLRNLSILVEKDYLKRELFTDRKIKSIRFKRLK